VVLVNEEGVKAAAVPAAMRERAAVNFIVEEYEL
jgi:hypothetical protein